MFSVSRIAAQYASIGFLSGWKGWAASPPSLIAIFWPMPAPTQLPDAFSSSALRPRVEKDGASYTISGIDPRRPDGIAFFHLERKLAAHVSLKGDEKEGPTIKLQPWSRIRGRILDADGKPMAAVAVRIDYYDEAGKRVYLDRFAHTVRPTVTVKDGIFTFDGLKQRLG